MAKKGIKKKSSSKSEKLANSELEKMLMDNFVNLQKVLTNLSVKFDRLSDQISKLLQLFEISAKSFVEKQSPEPNKEKDKEFLNKLDTLLEQNKTIARGLTLMEGKIRERVYGPGMNLGENKRPRYPEL